MKGFPLRGKLSPQVTDEGATAGHLPLIRRAGAPPSPKGEGFFPAQQKSAGTNVPALFLLVRKMGLEPTRHRHTHLKRACLPIPALPQIAFDCKKDSSTFGGIKSSPILYLFSCPIKRPLQPFLSFITVILTRKPFVGAVFAPTHGDGGTFWAIVGEHSICSRRISRRRTFPRANNVRPYGPHMVVCRGRRPRRPGNYAHLTGGFNIRPWYLAVSPNATGYCRKS